MDVIEDFLLALAGLQAGADQQAEILRDPRVGIGNRLVLADEAAELRKQVLRLLFEDRVGQTVAGKGAGDGGGG